MKKQTVGEKLFEIVNGILMVFMILITVYPLWYVVMASFSNSNALVGHTGILLAPLKFTTAAYHMVAQNPNIISGYSNTIAIVILGTTASTMLTAVGAYVLSRKPFPFKRVIMFLIVVTMYFSGGLIPRFLLLNNWLHLGNNRLVLILPNLVITYNLIVLRTGFEAIPNSLEESARIDGANEWLILFRIIIPVALPSMAIIVLFYAVHYWNAWFDAAIFLKDRDKFPIQVILREILITNSTENMMIDASGDREEISESIKYATIVVATVPILFVYPFVQKYFVKGVMIGAVKG